MALAAPRTQLSFDLFSTTALAGGLTLDAGGGSRPAPQAASQTTRRPEPGRPEPTDADFQFTGDRGLAASTRILHPALGRLAAERDGISRCIRSADGARPGSYKKRRKRDPRPRRR